MEERLKFTRGTVKIKHPFILILFSLSAESMQVRNSQITLRTRRIEMGGKQFLTKPEEINSYRKKSSTTWGVIYPHCIHTW